MTSDDYIPSNVHVIEDEDNNKLGVKYTRDEEGGHCERDGSNFDY